MFEFSDCKDFFHHTTCESTCDTLKKKFLNLEKDNFCLSYELLYKMPYSQALQSLILKKKKKKD